MNSPVDIPPYRKALAIALIAVVAVVIFEGIGIGAPARQAVAAATTQVKNFFARLFSKSASGT